MKQAYQESPFVTTEAVVDPLESLARLGAQRMLQAALEQEVEAYLQRARYERKGVAQGYRSGYLPKRSIILGSGAVPVKVPRMSDEPYRRLAQTISGSGSQSGRTPGAFAELL